MHVVGHVGMCMVGPCSGYGAWSGTHSVPNGPKPLWQFLPFCTHAVQSIPKNNVLLLASHRVDRADILWIENNKGI